MKYRELSSFALLPFSLLLAAAGFSFALATSGPATHSRTAQHSANSRAFNEPLRFTNPFLIAGTNGPATDPVFFPQGGDVPDDPQGFDLGDACPGTPIRRYITATGGFLPYTFTAKPVVGSGLGIFVPPLNLPFGRLDTSVPVGLADAARFDVLLEDLLTKSTLANGPVAESRTGRFKLTLLDPAATPFRFAQDTLPAAQQGRSYFTNIQTVAADAPVRYEVVEGSVSVNSVILGRLEEAGLTLAPDGTLFGRPIKPFNIKFNVIATETADIRYPSPGGKLALSRDSTKAFQDFTIKVENTLIVSTEAAASQVSIRGVVRDTPPTEEQKNLINDSFSYTGYLDSKGETTASLAGSTSVPFVLKLGGATYSGHFNDKGKVKITLDANGNPVTDSRATPATPPRIKPIKRSLDVSFSPSSGRLSIKLQGVDLTHALGRKTFVSPDGAGEKFNNNTVQPLILAFEIGTFRTCEVLQAHTAVVKGPYRMTYRLGARGYSRGGAFQILSVRGTDAAGNTGDRWKVRFMAVPAQDDKQAAPNEAVPTAPATILAATKVTVRIGDGFTQDVALTLKKTSLDFKAAPGEPGIYKLFLDAKRFVHSVETKVITAESTKIPAAITTKDPLIFPFGISFGGAPTGTPPTAGASFTGETGRVIVPNRTNWQQK